jgi:hypothetical protein
MKAARRSTDNREISVPNDYGCGAGALVSGTAGAAGVAGVSAALAGAAASASELELDCGLHPIKATAVNKDRIVSLVFMCFIGCGASGRFPDLTGQVAFIATAPGSGRYPGRQERQVPCRRSRPGLEGILGVKSKIPPSTGETIRFSGGTVATMLSGEDRLTAGPCDKCINEALTGPGSCGGQGNNAAR